MSTIGRKYELQKWQISNDTSAVMWAPKPHQSFLATIQSDMWAPRPYMCVITGYGHIDRKNGEKVTESKKDIFIFIFYHKIDYLEDTYSLK